MQAVDILGTGDLPACEDFTDTSDDCVHGSIGNTSSNMMLNCSEGFFFDGNGSGFCMPECGEFNSRPQAVVILEVISVWAGVLASAVFLALAFTTERKSL